MIKNKNLLFPFLFLGSYFYQVAEMQGRAILPATPEQILQAKRILQDFKNGTLKGPELLTPEGVAQKRIMG